jgi:hypothetical protein
MSTVDGQWQTVRMAQHHVWLCTEAAASTGGSRRTSQGTPAVSLLSGWVDESAGAPDV